MKKTLPVKFLFLASATFLSMGGSVVNAQTEQAPNTKRNSPFAQNPKAKLAKPEKAEIINKIEVPDTQGTTETVEVENKVVPRAITVAPENKEFESRSIASKTLEVVKRANLNAVSPTEIYKIGVGDVLFISLQNAPGKASTYFTVLNDGTIDYPLAGEMITVNGLTTEEIEDLLKEKIKLYEHPQVSVKVREHASHSITVLGLVEKAGNKFLPREAVPLFMIRAEAIVHPRAGLLVIKRVNLETEQVDLKDPKSDDVLIFPGDILEFKLSDDAAANTASPQFYYIGGNISSGGQREFHQGLTLTQAILASGGLRKSTVKKVVIRRRNQAGLLSPLEFNLDSIKAGKQPDPTINAGDTIEIGN